MQIIKLLMNNHSNNNSDNNSTNNSYDGIMEEKMETPIMGGQGGDLQLLVADRHLKAAASCFANCRMKPKKRRTRQRQ